MDSVVQADYRAVSRFHAAMRELASISGKDFQQVMRHEVGAILNASVRGTRKATTKSIQSNHDKQPGSRYAFDYAGPESRSGKQYSAADVLRLRQRAAERRSKAKNGKMVYYFSKSNEPKAYPAWVWRQIQDRRAKSLKARMGARGLAASMWTKIGSQLGIDVKAPAYVRNAKHHKKGGMEEMVQAYQKGRGKSYEIGFVNALTHLNQWNRVGVVFRKALNARANFFSQAVKLQAKGTIKRVMDRYPGMASVS
jgi:hypothetical protein